MNWNCNIPLDFDSDVWIVDLTNYLWQASIRQCHIISALNIYSTDLHTFKLTADGVWRVKVLADNVFVVCSIGDHIKHAFIRICSFVRFREDLIVAIEAIDTKRIGFDHSVVYSDVDPCNYICFIFFFRFPGQRHILQGETFNITRRNR